MHCLSTETLLTKYTLRGVARDPITLTVASMGLTAAGTAVSAMGTIAGGNAAAEAGERQQEAYYYRAKQEEQAAQESRASAQRAALEKRREGRFLQSKLQARAAASGAGADDPTVLDLAAGIAQRSEYDALFDMYRGENRARGLEDQAKGSRMTGDAERIEGINRKKASRIQAIGTIIGGASSMAGTYSDYTRRLPPPSTSRYG
jgi:hypothetical protein